MNPDRLLIRPNADWSYFFLLGSTLAQQGRAEDALPHMAHAVALAPDVPIVRFQWGFLYMTNGQPLQAQQAWAPLVALSDDHPHAYLKHFHQGMLHLIADEFDPALAALREGIACNTDNLPLNGDMAKVIDAIEHLPGRAPEAMLTAPAVESVAPSAPEATTPATTEEDQELSHLFINAYTRSSKSH